MNTDSGPSWRKDNQRLSIYFSLGANCKHRRLTLQRKCYLCILFLGIVRPQSQFPHSRVCEKFIYSQDRFTYLQQQNRQNDCGNILQIRNRSVSVSADESWRVGVRIKVRLWLCMCDSVHYIRQSTWTMQSPHKVHTYKEYYSICPSLELGLSHRLSRQRVCPSPRNQRVEGYTRVRVRGWGSPNSNDWRKSLALCLLCESLLKKKGMKTTCRVPLLDPLCYL